MPKKMPMTTLKNQLKDLPQQEIISLICSLYRSCPDAADVLNARFSGDDYVKELLGECKEKIQKEFSGRGLKAPSLSKAKKVISEFKKISTEQKDVIELKLYYLECLAEFGRSFGDMPESFYNSMENVFSDVVASLNKVGSEDLFTACYPRLQNIIHKMDGLGYGTSDLLSAELEEKLKWNPKEGEA